MCFNSKLVRLKVGHMNTEKQSPRFQFQTGSIKRFAKIAMLPVPAEFQFQTGSIKRQIPCSYDEFYPGFNSKLVRLKELKAAGYRVARALFQFQTGSIKSVVAHNFVIQLYVSIPNWFD